MVKKGGVEKARAEETKTPNREIHLTRKPFTVLQQEIEGEDALK